METFKLNNLGHIITKVKAHRTQEGLTQCYNCQKFSHIWANCRQPPALCGVGMDTSTGNALRTMSTQPPAAATSCLQWGRNPIPQLIMAAAMQKNYSVKRYREPPRQRLQLGEPSSPGTQPQHFSSQQHSAEIRSHDNLSGSSHNLSRPRWE